MGSAACRALARRGAKVLGLEQFALGHALGSSHGESRLIRQAYFEHPDYVPLLKSAYELWAAVEAESGEALFARTGLVLFGPETGPILRGAQDSARLYGIPLEVFAGKEAAARFPAFTADPGDIAVYEPGAGWLAVERCVRTLAGLATKHGAEIREGVHVESWTADGRGVAVRTSHGEFKARRLVITAGAWSADFLARVRGKIAVRRVPVAWFAPRGAAPAMPCFGFEDPRGFFYGFPPLSAQGVKVGLHLPGAAVADPAKLDRALHDDDVAPLAAFLAARLPWVDPRPRAHSVCMYSMSPDEHFIVDRDSDRVTYAAGFSGHGFKFAPVIGELLADLALDGATGRPAEFLRHRWPAP